MINLNNAGCSNLSPKALEKVIEITKKEALSCGYDIASSYEHEIKSLYTNIAKLIGANSSEIAFTQSSTLAWQLILESMNFAPGDEILYDDSEYSSNYLYLLKLRQEKNIVLKKVKKNHLFQTDIEDLKKKITKKTKLVSIVDIATCHGNRNDTLNITKYCASINIPTILDACQSVGQSIIDVKELECDYLVASGRKFLRAPRGTGFLYIKKSRQGYLKPRFIDLESASWINSDHFQVLNHAKKFELWERSTSLMLGLNAAIEEYFDYGAKNIVIKNQEIRDYLFKKLEELEFIKIHEDKEIASNIITIVHQKTTHEEVKKNLLEHNILVGLSKRENSRLNPDFLNNESKIRISPHYYNTNDQIDVLIEVLKISS